MFTLIMLNGLNSKSILQMQWPCLNAQGMIRCGIGSYLFFVWSQAKHSQRAAGGAAGSGRQLWGGASLGRGWCHQGLIG